MSGLTVNSIYLKKCNKVLVPDPSFTNGTPINYVSSVVKNVMELGYILSPAVVNEISKLSCDQLEAFNNSVISSIKEMLGAHVVHNVFYPNFPKQVMKASEAELFFNAIVHYFSAFINDLSDGEIPSWFPDFNK